MTHVDWHPFPKEKPKNKSRLYQVVRLKPHRYCTEEESLLDFLPTRAFLRYEDFYKNNVIAWADINEENQTVWLTYGEYEC